MMPTSDERLEVAEKLRQMADAHDATEASRVARALGLEYKVYGTVVAFDSADMRNLADLIDPTCILKDATWDDGTCTWGCICSACGAKLEYEHAQDLAYCPACGARNEGAMVWNA